MILPNTDKTYLSAITITNISQSFTYKMAAKINWHNYVTVTLCIYSVTVTSFRSISMPNIQIKATGVSLGRRSL